GVGVGGAGHHRQEQEVTDRRHERREEDQVRGTRPDEAAEDQRLSGHGCSYALMGALACSCSTSCRASSSRFLGTMIFTRQNWSPSSSPRLMPRPLMRSFAPLLVPGGSVRVTSPSSVLTV